MGEKFVCYKKHCEWRSPYSPYCRLECHLTRLKKPLYLPRWIVKRLEKYAPETLDELKGVRG